VRISVLDYLDIVVIIGLVLAGMLRIANIVQSDLLPVKSERVK
jgi:hypothetical protein